MEVVFILIPVSLLIVILAIWGFVWSVRTDQYEDLEKEAFRILVDDKPEMPLSELRANLSTPRAVSISTAPDAVEPENNPNNDRSAS